MRSARFIGPAVAAAAALAALLLGVVAIRRVKPLLTVPRGSAVAVWGRFVSSTANEISVTLAPAPAGGASAALPQARPGTPFTALISPATAMTADYYVGSIATGALIKSEPLNLPRLPAGTLLRLAVQPAGSLRWAAIAVSRPQSISQPSQLPPPDAKILPAIRPP